MQQLPSLMREYMDNKLFHDSVLFDLSNAFDRREHKLLHSKLYNDEITGTSLDLIVLFCKQDTASSIPQTVDKGSINYYLEYF
jgi:hypothetical protein